MPDDVADEYSIEVWPDTESAVYLFIELRTQWRMGFNGPTGLDYSAIETLMRLRDMPPAQRGGVFDDLRVMEDEALRTIAEDSK